MRPSLLKSFVVVVTVWFLGTTLVWSLSEPETNLEHLRALARLLPWANLHVPSRVDVLDALGMQKQVLLFWTAPLLAATVAAALLGYGAVWLLSWRQHQARQQRESPQGNYRGLSCTLGRLPQPPAVPQAGIDLDAADKQLLQRFTAAQKNCLSGVLGIAAAHPQAYGAQPGQAFVMHVLAAANRALDGVEHPGLTALAAAAYELGRISGYRRDDSGAWSVVKPQGREAARYLTALPAWWALPRQERLAVLLAVKYRDCPKALPNPDDAVYKLAKALLTSQPEANRAPPPSAQPGVPSATAPSSVSLDTVDEVDNRPLSEQLFSHFMRFLPQLPFQSPGQPKSVPAVGWKVGTRVYLLENALRNSLTQRLPAALRSALESGDYAKKTKLPPMTYELVSAFEARGLLVREIGKAKVDLAQPFWKISAGIKDFQRVLILEANEEMLPMLPPQDSYYAVTVLGPQYAPPGNYAMKASDLASLLQ